MKKIIDTLPVFKHEMKVNSYVKKINSKSTYDCHYVAKASRIKRKRFFGVFGYNQTNIKISKFLRPPPPPSPPPIVHRIFIDISSISKNHEN